MHKSLLGINPWHRFSGRKERGPRTKKSAIVAAGELKVNKLYYVIDEV